jgi:hypothetical protein
MLRWFCVRHGHGSLTFTYQDVKETTESDDVTFTITWQSSFASTLIFAIPSRCSSDVSFIHNDLHLARLTMQVLRPEHNARYGLDAEP